MAVWELSGILSASASLVSLVTETKILGVHLLTTAFISKQLNSPSGLQVLKSREFTS